MGGGGVVRWALLMRPRRMCHKCGKGQGTISEVAVSPVSMFRYRTHPINYRRRCVLMSANTL